MSNGQCLSFYGLNLILSIYLGTHFPEFKAVQQKNSNNKQFVLQDPHTQGFQGLLIDLGMEDYQVFI